VHDHKVTYDSDVSEHDILLALSLKSF